jgi:gas vesicle protein
MGQAAEEQMTTEIAGTRENLSRDVDALYDKVSPSRVIDRRKAAARSRLSSMKDRVMGSAEGAAGSVGGTASGAAGAAGGTAQQVTSAVHRQTVGSPLGAGLIAFGAGMIVSALFPASQKEAEAAQRLKQTAQEHGQPLMDEAKSVGQDVGQQLKDKAAAAAEDLKSSVQDSARTVSEEGQSAAQSVKEEAQPGGSSQPTGTPYPTGP